MDRKALIGLFLILMVWMVFLPKAPQTPPAGKSPAESATEKSPASASSLPLKTPSAQVTAAKVIEVPELPRIMENADLKLTFTSRQAALTGVELKNYRVEKKKDAPWVDLAASQPLLGLFTLTLKSEGASGNSENAPEITLPLEGFRETAFDATQRTLVYAMDLPQYKVRVEQHYHLSEKDYDVFAETHLINLSKDRLQRQQLGISWHSPLTEVQRRGLLSAFGPPPDFWQALALLGQNKLETLKVRNNETTETAGPLSWASIGDRYFLMALFPKWEGLKQLRTTQTTQTEGNASKTRLQTILWSHQLKMDPGTESVLKYRLFLGPKELNLLEAQGNHLDRALNLGMFEFFALYLLKLLRVFHHFLGNWGLAIIALTFLVKLIFYPLTQKSFKSMKEMQKIQPMIAALKEKYGDKKEQFNLEMMKLMKEHRVNPMGGCLPMLVQFPIWIALYRVLYSSIELRHTPFYLWIHDLSARDPYFVTPIILGGLMVLQQKMSPKPPDPVQAKMMLLMPVMFTGLMLFLPSGLVLYIICNTVLSLLQQWYINRSLGLKPSFASTALTGEARSS